MVYRVYVEKKPGLQHEARALKSDIRDFLGISALRDVRVWNRYDVENISEALFGQAVDTVFSEPPTDIASDRIDAGDGFCAAVFRESASHLATILSYTIDILNPEVIVLGGVFMRQHERFMREIEPIIAREALPLALRACRIVPAGLSENIGDYAALAVANMEG